MLLKSSHVFGQGRTYLLAALGIASVTVAVGMRARVNKTASATVEPQGSPQPTRNRIEGEVITLRPAGFEPRHITRSEGPFHIFINNYCHLSVATLLIERENGVPVRKISLPEDKRTWSDIVDLPAGNYRLRETTHSHWFCQITLR